MIVIVTAVIALNIWGLSVVYGSVRISYLSHLELVGNRALRLSIGVLCIASISSLKDINLLFDVINLHCYFTIN